MKKALVALLLIGIIAGAMWYGATQRDASARSTAAEQSEASAYDFEAQDVRVRQMDAAGRLQYELEARHVVQMRDGGGMLASELTLYHDPPSATDTARRWKLTAAEGQLPAEKRIVRLSGGVQATGVPSGWPTPLHVSTASLNYDLAAEKIFTEEEVEFTRGCSTMRGRSLQVDVATGELALKSGHGTLCR